MFSGGMERDQWQIPDEFPNCLSAIYHFVGLALKGLTIIALQSRGSDFLRIRFCLQK